MITRLPTLGTVLVMAMMSACRPTGTQKESANAASYTASATTAAPKSTAGNAPPGSNQRAQSRPTACSLIDRTEMSTLLGAPIGKPSGDDRTSAMTSCTYPPADAGSRAQAEVTIEWEHDSASPPFAQQLVDAFGGSVVGDRVAHAVPLGDSAAFSREGVLTVRKGAALLTVTVPIRPDAESRATAVGRRIVDLLGWNSAPATATTATSVEDKVAAALGALVEASSPPPSSSAAGDASLALPPGFTPDAPCPDAQSVAADPGVASPLPPIPLVEGLTLSQSWIPTAGDNEHECLIQITKVDDREIAVTRSCPIGASRRSQTDHRRVCRTDLSRSGFYAPGTSSQTPELMTGATFFSLSQFSFSELAAGGETSHRFIHFKAGEMKIDLAGRLRRAGFSTYHIIVNDRAVDLPVMELSGTLGGDDAVHPRGFVLNDPRFPLLLDFGWDDYAVRFTKISFPTPSQLEAALDKDRRVDVYGVYFDFASDAIRPESEPVLQEIAAVLGRNPDWTLSINGHTDNIGGDRSNLDLSRRRSEAVRKVLTERYRIAAGRLSASGYGASQPKDTNDTIEGRALNRRVELIRR